MQLQPLRPTLSTWTLREHLVGLQSLCTIQTTAVEVGLHRLDGNDDYSTLGARLCWHLQLGCEPDSSAFFVRAVDVYDTGAKRECPLGKAILAEVM